MSILDEKLSIVAEKLINKDGRNKLYDRIADCPGKYEWARIVMLIGGQKLLLDGENLSFSIVFKRYGMEKFYGLGAFQKAIGTALTGKTGNASPSCTLEEIGKEIEKFKEGNYKWDWSLREFVQYIYDNEAHASNSKTNLQYLLELGDDFSFSKEGGLVMISQNSLESIVEKNIDNNKQVIFTGAPGTGKTFSVREYVKQQCQIVDDRGNPIVDKKQYKFVQFHPSYDYSDFVEGLRPAVLKGQEEPTFVRMDGVFKAFCRHIVQENRSEKKYYFIVDEINRADLAKVFGELMFGLEESYRGEKNKFDTQYKNLVTYRIVEQEDIESDSTKYTQDDLGKAIPIEQDVFKEGFYIPENLYFIGTMNDIDRSVDSMDFALRRRFQWVNINANEIMKSSLHSMLDNDNEGSSEKIDELGDRIIAMNKMISEEKKLGLSEAYHIGPAYFKKMDINNYDEKINEIFENNIASILREYTRGRKAEEVNNWIEKCKKALLGLGD